MPDQVKLWQNEFIELTNGALHSMQQQNSERGRKLLDMTHCDLNKTLKHCLVHFANADNSHGPTLLQQTTYVFLVLFGRPFVTEICVCLKLKKIFSKEAN